MKQQRPSGTLREWYTCGASICVWEEDQWFLHIDVLCETARLRECVLRDAMGRGDADIICTQRRQQWLNLLGETWTDAGAAC